MSQLTTPRSGGGPVGPASARCVVALSGALITLSLPALPHAPTALDAAAALQHQFGAPAEKLYLFADGGGALAPSDALPHDAALVLFCDLSLLRHFGSDGATPQRLEHQRRALAVLPAPAAEHCALLRKDLADTRRRLEADEAHLAALAQALPAALSRLEATPLIDDPSRTLRDHMCALNDWEAVTERARAALQDAGASVARVDAAVPALEASVASLGSAAEPGGDQSGDVLLVARRGLLQERFLALLRLLKQITARRRALQAAATSCRAVRHNLAKLELLPSLPEAYAAAHALCDRRLVFFRAAHRVHALLAEELNAVQSDTDAFLGAWGQRFPRDLIPGIDTPPRLPAPQDAAAHFLQQAGHWVDPDDDAPSLLLDRLQLGGNRTAGAALRAELADAQQLVSQLQTDLAAAQASAESANARAAAAEEGRASAASELERCMAGRRSAFSLLDAAAQHPDPGALCDAVFETLFPNPGLRFDAAMDDGVLAFEAVVRGVCVTVARGSVSPQPTTIGETVVLDVVSVVKVLPRRNTVCVLTAVTTT